MEEIGSCWNYQENMDHVQQKLVFATLALEAVKMEANEELNKYKQYIKHLGGLLKIAYQERDESRKQHQKLLDNIAAPSGNVVVPCLTRANSSITESNNSYGSPTDESFVSSPDSTNMAVTIVRNQPYNHHGSIPVAPKEYDVIDDLCRGLSLPQTGSLLKVMMDSGPLLSSFLVSGPLPQWKNPPSLQPLKIPPFSINVFQVGSKMCSFGSGSSQNDDWVAKIQRFQ